MHDGIFPLLKQQGIMTAFCSGESDASIENRAKKLQIDHLIMGSKDKVKDISALLQKLNLDFGQVAYVGDDVNDLPSLHAVGCPCTVADAMPANRACAIYVTRRPGGQGAVREICDVLVQLHTPS